MSTLSTEDDAPSPALVEGAGQVLSLLRSGAAHTVSQVASAMGLARSTVLQRLEFLEDAGLLQRQATRSGSRGRPASLIQFHAGAAVVLAAHVGMTGCRLAATDLAGTVLGEAYFDTDLAGGPDELIVALERHFDRLLKKIGRRPTELAAVSVGIPAEAEMLGYARSIGARGGDWSRDTLGQRLGARYAAPVFIDSDVTLLALAEHRNSWSNAEVLVCVKLGTLIDAAVVVNGTAVRGAAGLAGALGHIKVSGAAEACTCGGVGCLDAVASGRALVAAARSQGLEVEHISELVRLAAEGHPDAVLAVRSAGRRIGEALATAVNLLNPTAVVTWGYLTGAETALFAGMREGLYQAAFPGASGSVTLTRSGLGDLAGVLGAAQRALDEVLAPDAVDQMILRGSWSLAA